MGPPERTLEKPIRDLKQTLPESRPLDCAYVLKQKEVAWKELGGRGRTQEMRWPCWLLCGAFQVS